jgi:hypothetical protein
MYYYCSQFTTNNDFSFVRFLKVVKTLYESSTFTQLGKTVGSALNPLESPTYQNKKEEEAKKNGRGSGKKSSRNAGGDSIFDALAEACTSSAATRNKSTNVDDQSTIARKDTLLEQVIRGCTLLANPVHDEFSDEDTFKTPTDEDELSYGSDEGGSYETVDDDYSSPRNTASRRSKRRQRH